MEMKKMQENCKNKDRITPLGEKKKQIFVVMRQRTKEHTLVWQFHSYETPEEGKKDINGDRKVITGSLPVRVLGHEIMRDGS